MDFTLPTLPFLRHRDRRLLLEQPALWELRLWAYLPPLAFLLAGNIGLACLYPLPRGPEDAGTLPLSWGLFTFDLLALVLLALWVHEQWQWWRAWQPRPLSRKEIEWQYGGIQAVVMVALLVPLAGHGLWLSRASLESYPLSQAILLHWGSFFGLLLSHLLFLIRAAGPRAGLPLLAANMTLFVGTIFLFGVIWPPSDFIHLTVLPIIVGGINLMAVVLFALLYQLTYGVTEMIDKAITPHLSVMALGIVTTFVCMGELALADALREALSEGPAFHRMRMSLDVAGIALVGLAALKLSPRLYGLFDAAPPD